MNSKIPDSLIKYAEEKAGQTEYRYYSEYVRNVHVGERYSYEGSGPATIKRIVEETFANSKEKIDKLIKTLEDGKSVVVEDQRFRTSFFKKK